MSNYHLSHIYHSKVEVQKTVNNYSTPIFDHFEHIPVDRFKEIEEAADNWNRLPKEVRDCLSNWKFPEPLQIVRQ